MRARAPANVRSQGLSRIHRPYSAGLGGAGGLCPRSCACPTVPLRVTSPAPPSPHCAKGRGRPQTSLRPRSGHSSCGSSWSPRAQRTARERPFACRAPLTVSGTTPRATPRSSRSLLVQHRYVQYVLMLFSQDKEIQPFLLYSHCSRRCSRACVSTQGLSQSSPRSDPRVRTWHPPRNTSQCKRLQTK